MIFWAVHELRKGAWDLRPHKEKLRQPALPGGPHRCRLAVDFQPGEDVPLRS